METISEIPFGCHYYSDPKEMPWDVQKYWHQRYSIFSKYDDGIWMTDDAWFGVTPEPVACKIAQHVSEAASAKKAVLIDCFAGVGGNTIAFARSDRWTRVYAIEKNPHALACAKHNARLYGVHNKISWYLGDCFDIISGQLRDLHQYAVLFASPPWGGRLGVNQMPYNLSELLEPFRKHSDSVALYLPRTSDLKQLARQPTTVGKTTVIHYCIEGASKALCAYIGDFKFDWLHIA
ncbi:MAG: hypothetical protein Q9191_004597 [Dirinaria sp. TL-2023a]